MNRESIYAAFFALISAVPGVVIKSRRLKHWTDVAPIDQPALFMTQKRENAVQNTNMPTKWTLHAEVIVYANVGADYNATPSQILNPIIDAICAAITPDEAVGEQTLGGLVHRCRIDGAIETDEGALGEQGVVIIPVVIYLAS